MFGFGNRKRIIELQESIDLLCVRIRTLEKISNRDFSRILAANTVAPCKCEPCGINTNGETTSTLLMPFGQSIDIKTPIKISAASAIKKIMDHLGLEFDHIEATNPDTVIKPKETP